MRFKTILACACVSSFAMLSAQAARADDMAGSMQYDASAGKMEFYDGTNWFYLVQGLTVGSCSTPGAMGYNTTLSEYQVCNGTGWVQIPGALTLTACNKPAQMDYSGGTFMVCNGTVQTNIKGVQVPVQVAGM